MPSSTPLFWRDPALPFLEFRSVADGRAVCYAPHSHQTVSIGVITGGASLYRNDGGTWTTGTGDIVAIAPEAVHACSPRDGAAWAYDMLYMDPNWLAEVQGTEALHTYDRAPLHAPALVRRLHALTRRLADPATDIMAKQEAAVIALSALHARLAPAATPLAEPPGHLRRAAAFITDNCTRPMTLAEIAAQAGLSPTQCIRAFRRRFGLTPHAYLVNRRIQYSQGLLKRGRPLADVALAAGFADQAHFQRTFKRLVAATPRQYQAATR